jgi:hypothetical protein
MLSSFDLSFTIHSSQSQSHDTIPLNLSALSNFQSEKRLNSVPGPSSDRIRSSNTDPYPNMQIMLDPDPQHCKFIPHTCRTYEST